ncbi:hypothetical protein IAD21_00070 [Abditibacteriota bacterium]|nr:hypothetical protein IAD21_00070 [Abditibacteriota bacterium]
MQPSVLGLKKSFGFGDRLGLATPGHLAAAKRFDFAPIFAQQSIREMERTQRTPDQVMNAAKSALTEADFAGTWGSDADHLKTARDIEVTAAAGFTFFTIDPSAGVNNGADSMSEIALNEEVVAQREAGLWNDFSLGFYTDGAWDVAGETLKFSDESLHRAVAKYGRAVALAGDLAAHIAKVSGENAFEIEVSVDETDAPTSPLEHLFFALELKRRGVQNLVSLAPRFVGDMEKGVDYKGDLGAFESELQKHFAIAKALGPYKISVHSGSDKFSIYPIVGRVCGDLLHVKTAGTSYLEALRCALQSDEALFGDIARFSHQRFDTDRATYHISATSADNAALAQRELTGAALEDAYLNDDRGRQILHVTFGSVLTDEQLKPRLIANLEDNSGLHSQLLEHHFIKHLEALSAG